MDVLKIGLPGGEDEQYESDYAKSAYVDNLILDTANSLLYGSTGTWEGQNGGDSDKLIIFRIDINSYNMKAVTLTTANLVISSIKPVSEASLDIDVIAGNNDSKNLIYLKILLGSSSYKNIKILETSMDVVGGIFLGNTFENFSG